MSDFGAESSDARKHIDGEGNGVMRDTRALSDRRSYSYEDLPSELRMVLRANILMGGTGLGAIVRCVAMQPIIGRQFLGERPARTPKTAILSYACGERLWRATRASWDRQSAEGASRTRLLRDARECNQLP